MFFFQAEDGIRDLVRSRGLGDVYKRQSVPGCSGARGAGGDHQPDTDNGHVPAGTDPGRIPVSYTHLTLPTSDLV